MRHNHLTAVVAGGGICGPVTAMALQYAGIKSVVYDARDPHAAGAGSYLTVATNGLDALGAIDAAGPVIAASFPTPAIEMRSGTGRVLGVVPMGSTRRTVCAAARFGARICTARCTTRRAGVTFASSSASA